MLYRIHCTFIIRSYIVHVLYYTFYILYYIVCLLYYIFYIMYSIFYSIFYMFYLLQAIIYILYYILDIPYSIFHILYTPIGANGSQQEPIKPIGASRRRQELICIHWIRNAVVPWRTWLPEPRLIKTIGKTKKNKKRKAHTARTSQNH